MESNFNTLKTDAFFPLVLLDFTIVLNLKEFQVHSVFFLLVLIKALKREEKKRTVCYQHGEMSYLLQLT